MPLAEDQNVIQALAPECPDEALNICILPGRINVLAPTEQCAPSTDIVRH